jgi:hypothetical protein
MTEAKKERKMTPKGFLRKLSTAKSAIGFIEAHRAYLTTGELAPLTSPIVHMVDSGALMPTPALTEIQSAVWSHIMLQDQSKAERFLLPKEEKEPKAYVAQILDELGRVQFHVTDSGDMKELIADFDMPQDAERWVDRQLVDGAPNWHGSITWLLCPEKLNPVRIVSRDESMKRLLRAPRMAVHKTVKVGTSGGLGFGVKVKQDAAKFSRG